MGSSIKQTVKPGTVFLDDVDSISFFLSAFVQKLPDYDEWAIR